MKKSIFGLLVLLSTGLFAQEKYWIYFKGKQVENSAGCVSVNTRLNRLKLNLPQVQFTDLPVDRTYTDSLSKSFNIEIITSSKWLNAVTAYLNQHLIDSISRLGFVSKIEKAKHTLVMARSNNDSGDNWPLAFKQMHAAEFRKNGLTGKGVVIGVLDGRYTNVNRLASIKHIVEGKHISGMRNFATLDSPEFLKKEQTSKEGHCPQVIKLIGGINEEDGSPAGLSPDASFYLARTEIAERELKVEEDFWISGLEWLDSLGVRLVNSSIGYSAGFEQHSDNHKVTEVDGMSTEITKAARVAAEKGMILVLAAGNEGDNIFWKILSVPSDARRVITVGAVDEKGLKQDYSSIGPKALPYLKPDISVFSSNGTSFAAPVITGLVACMLQKDPTLKIDDILKILQESGKLYPYGNNYVGYGVPDANKILRRLDKRKLRSTARQVHVKGDHYDFKVPEGITEILIFEKTDPVNVIHQEILKAGSEQHVTIENKQKASRTTIVAGDLVTELIWRQAK